MPTQTDTTTTIGTTTDEAKTILTDVTAAYTVSERQTVIDFVHRSLYIQPWQGYQETHDWNVLTGGIGINLNVPVSVVEATCRHLKECGILNVRLEVGWGSIDFETGLLRSPGDLAKVFAACKKNGLRPLILLNGHHAAPCPIIETSVTITAPAEMGDRVVRIDPAHPLFSRFIVGRSGLSHLSDYWAAECLFTEIGADGTISLSRPLPRSLPKGDAFAAILKYAPWHTGYIKEVSGGDALPPKRHPEYIENMQAWVRYFNTIGQVASPILGTGGFDFEVWNELTFGSNFLDVSRYYAEGESPAPSTPQITDDFRYDLLRAVVEWTGRKYPGCLVTDGFASQQPWQAGSTSPPGLAALSKHPYGGRYNYEQERGVVQIGYPLDALGNVDSIPGTEGDNRGAMRYIPKDYTTLLPEVHLLGEQNGMIRDFSPVPTMLFDKLHGRGTSGEEPDGSPALGVGLWVTEVNLGADSGDRDKPYPLPVVLRWKAKAALRYFASYLGKGAARVYLFATHDPDPAGLGMIDPAFLAAVERGNGAFPANVDALTSPAFRAVVFLAKTVRGVKVKEKRSITIESVSDAPNPDGRVNGVQFDGDPTTAHLVPNPCPPLYNRNCVYVQAYQTRDNEFSLTAYVMTRDMSRVYRDDLPEGDPARLDMPEESYFVTITGVRHTAASKYRMYDALTQKGVNVPAVPFAGGVRLTLPLTDSVRIVRMSGV